MVHCKTGSYLQAELFGNAFFQKEIEMLVVSGFCRIGIELLSGVEKGMKKMIVQHTGQFATIAHGIPAADKSGRYKY